MVLVQLHEIKIIFGAVCSFVVELEHTHVLLLDFHSSIVEWVCSMLASGYSNDHIRSQHRIICSFYALWRYSKYSAHRLLAIIFDCKYKDYFLNSQEKTQFYNEPIIIRYSSFIKTPASLHSSINSLAAQLM